MPDFEDGRWQMEDGSKEPNSKFQIPNYAVCGVIVHGLWVICGYVICYPHKSFTPRAVSGKLSTTINSLYQKCAQSLHIAIQYVQSVNFEFYSLSTRLTKTTTFEMKGIYSL